MRHALNSFPDKVAVSQLPHDVHGQLSEFLTVGVGHAGETDTEPRRDEYTYYTFI